VDVIQAWEDAINISLFKPEDLIFDIVKKRYPIILYVTSIFKEDILMGSSMMLDSKEDEIIEKTEPTNKMDMTNCQITYLNILLKDRVDVGVEVLYQKILYLNMPYMIHDIYGVEASSAGDCVICMTEPRNVVVLPCKHMCLCIACADIYRIKSNKCPICRAPLRSLIKVNDDKTEEEQDLPINTTTTATTTTDFDDSVPSASNSTNTSNSSVLFDDYL